MLCIFFSFTDSKPKIRRRHSLHSPTSDPRLLIKHLSSANSKSLSHPTSMLLDMTGNMKLPEQERTELDVDDSTLTTLLVPPFDSKTITSRSRSRSNQNLATNGGFSQSFFNTASRKTCSGSVAASTSPLHCVPSTINSMMSLSSASGSSNPTLVSPLSQASSSDSPSPVERDCLLSTNSSSDTSSPRNNSMSLTSKHSEFKSLELHSNRVVVIDSRRLEHYGTSDSGSMGTHVQKSPGLVSTALHYLGSSPHHVNLSLHKQPHHSLSNPEFPLTTTRICVNQADRTYSHDNLYAPRKKPPFHPPTKVSPSREKINNLSSHICSSLNQNCTATLSTYASQHLLEDTPLSSGSSPVCEVMQKIINITTPLLKFNQAHIQTLMSSVGCSQSIHQDFLLVDASPSSLNTTCVSSFADVEPVHDSPVEYLSKLGYKLIDKPLSVQLGIPLEGYLTLMFKLLGEDLQIKDALLKVSSKTF